MTSRWTESIFHAQFLVAQEQGGETCPVGMH
jgi:hypothetical protein